MDANDAYVNIAAPRGTPPEVISRLESALRRAMSDPVLLKRLAELDIQAVFLDAKATGAWLAKDVARLERVISDADLKPGN
jgi:tripartite-type tricarboxylate transporter receptor subunit TctC